MRAMSKAITIECSDFLRKITPKDEIQTRTRAVAMPSWRANSPAQHEGYLSWNEFVQTKDRLAKSRTNNEETAFSGPVREGLALRSGSTIL
jgi:hypothetical protein